MSKPRVTLGALNTAKPGVLFKWNGYLPQDKTRIRFVIYKSYSDYWHWFIAYQPTQLGDMLWSYNQVLAYGNILSDMEVINNLVDATPEALEHYYKDIND